MNLYSRYAALGASLLIIAALIYFFTNIVGYVVIAWILSMLGQPLADRIRRIRIKRFSPGPATSAIIVILLYMLLVFLLVRLFVPLFVQQANNLAGVDYIAITRALSEPLERFNAWLASLSLSEMAVSEEQFRQALGIETWFKPDLIANLFSSLINALGSIAAALFAIIFITFFFLKEENLFSGFLRAIIPNQYEENVRNALDTTSRLLTRYFGGILAQITIITLYVTLAMSIFGIKNALLIGFFAALINVIPYIGPIIGAAFGIFITISSNLELDFYTELFPMLVTVAAIFASMQLLDNMVLQPWIFSRSVMAHPLEIFIVVLMGARIGGIVGMVLAIPSYTVLRVIARSFLSEFSIVQKLTGSLEGKEGKGG
jgi:predicted PurR-regulated permease PerM